MAKAPNGKASDGDLIDRIYEASVIPELWPEVLESISIHVGAAGSNLIVVDGGAPRWISSPSLLDITERYFREGWDHRNGRMDALLRGGCMGFTRDIDILDRVEIASLPVVRDFLRPAGYGWTVANATPVPTGEFLVLSVEQHFDEGPVSDAAVGGLENLRAHIARASLLAAKLRFERARAVVDGFGLAALPAAVARVDGRVIAANNLFVELGGQLAIGARDRLRLAFPAAQSLLEAALSPAVRRGGKQPPLSIAVPANDGALPMVLHVLPAERAAQDIFGASTSLVIVTKLTERAAPDTGLLRALFDLTPTEAKVAQAIAGGRESSEIAADLGMAVETLRWHVKSILQKTGFSRRVDFVRFLSPITFFQEASWT